MWPWKNNVDSEKLLLRNCHHGDSAALAKFTSRSYLREVLRAVRAELQDDYDPDKVEQIAMTCVGHVTRCGPVCRPRAPTCTSAFARPPRRLPSDGEGRISVVEPDKREWLRQAFVHEAPGVTLVLIRRFGCSRDEAVDAVQQAYLRLEGRLQEDEPFRNDLPLRYYMLGAARSYLSHERERVSRFDRNVDLLLEAIDPEADPEAQAISSERRRQLRQAIGALNKPSRKVFQKLLDESMSLAEIARELGIPLKTIYVTYSRGVKRLRKLLHLV